MDQQLLHTTVSASPCSDTTTTQDVNITDTWVTSVLPISGVQRYIGIMLIIHTYLKLLSVSWNESSVGHGTDFNNLSWETATFHANNGSNKQVPSMI